MPATAYRFGPFELRAGEHILTRNGTRVPLSPKAFDLLHLLVRHNGSLLEKRELLATLWPRTFVEEANLSVQVAAIRKALHPPLADAIETVPIASASCGCRALRIARKSTRLNSSPVKSSYA